MTGDKITVMPSGRSINASAVRTDRPYFSYIYVCMCTNIYILYNAYNQVEVRRKYCSNKVVQSHSMAEDDR